MKKYFVSETDEELQFGDIIGITFEKVLEDGKVTVEKEVKFSEDMIEPLLDLGVIQEDGEEDGGEEPTCYAIQDLMEGFENIEDRVEKLEEAFKSIYDLCNEAVKDVKRENKKKVQVK